VGSQRAEPRLLFSQGWGGLKEFSLTDGTQIQISPGINDASAAIQFVLGKMLGFNDGRLRSDPLAYTQPTWHFLVSHSGSAHFPTLLKIWLNPNCCCHLIRRRAGSLLPVHIPPGATGRPGQRWTLHRMRMLLAAMIRSCGHSGRRRSGGAISRWASHPGSGWRRR